jgi:hypothetical protein
MGAGVPRTGAGPEESIPDDRFGLGTTPPTSGHGPQKGGTDKALGRTRGGLTTKIHLLADELGLPLGFLVTAGQVADCTQAIDLLGACMRNRIERCFSKLKQFRRLATRYEKSKICFQAMVALACTWITLQLYVDTA